MKCSRKNCPNKAEFSNTYGVLPCHAHQKAESQPIVRRYQFANIGKLDRIQRERDGHIGDLEQPYINNKANPKFFKIYPEKVKDFGVEKELKRM